jgi:hypothetical protein
LVVDSSAGLAVDLVEAHVLAAGCREDPDRDVDQAEADGAGPDRAWHSF